MDDQKETSAAQVPPQAIVLFGDRLIELPEAQGPTLQDLCDAFDISFVPGTYIQEHVSGRVVATLPFETLPKANTGTEVRQAESFLPREHHAGGDLESVVGTNAAENATKNSDDEDHPEPVLFDLIVPGNDVHDVDNANEEEDIDPLEGVPEALTEAASRLVKLGAVGLLSEETEARVESNPYVAEDAPGLLKRILYGDEVYCPYRSSRDPLHTSRAEATKVASGHARERLYGNEKPYWATLATYDIPHLGGSSSDENGSPSHPLLFGRPLSAEQQARLFASL